MSGLQQNRSMINDSKKSLIGKKLINLNDSYIALLRSIQTHHFDLERFRSTMCTNCVWNIVYRAVQCPKSRATIAFQNEFVRFPTNEARIDWHFYELLLNTVTVLGTQFLFTEWNLLLLFPFNLYAFRVQCFCVLDIWINVMTRHKCLLTSRCFRGYHLNDKLLNYIRLAALSVVLLLNWIELTYYYYSSWFMMLDMIGA